MGAGHVTELRKRTAKELPNFESELMVRGQLKYCGLHHAREWTSGEKRLVETAYQISSARDKTTTYVATESNNSEKN